MSTCQLRMDQSDSTVLHSSRGPNVSHDQQFVFQALDLVSGPKRGGEDRRRGASWEFFSSGLPAPAAPPRWSSGCWSSSPGDRSWSSSRTPAASSTPTRRTVASVVPLRRPTCRDQQRPHEGDRVLPFTIKLIQ